MNNFATDGVPYGQDERNQRRRGDCPAVLKLNIGGNHKEGMTDGKTGTKDEERKVQIQDAENQTRWQQRPQTGSDGSDKQMRKGGTTCTKKSMKCVTGGRKVCGARKKQSCDRLLKRLPGLCERWHVDFML